jgi:hypothetical protein
MASSNDESNAAPPASPAPPADSRDIAAPDTSVPARSVDAPSTEAPSAAAAAPPEATTAAAPAWSADGPIREVTITDASLPEAPGAPAPIPVVPAAPPPTFTDRLLQLRDGTVSRVRAYFAQEPTFWIAAAPLLVLSAILFTRLPNTNYIFDEQEALLANPYVNRTQGLGFIDAIHRDFWGLPPDRSVGSYRPIPNFMWRLLWHVSKQPFVHHFYNVLFHALVGALLTLFAYRITRRKDVAYLSGFVFVACAVLTEAVSGIVGIADVLGGVGALLALLSLGLPGWAMPFAVFGSILFAPVLQGERPRLRPARAVRRAARGAPHAPEAARPRAPHARLARRRDGRVRDLRRAAQALVPVAAPRRAQQELPADASRMKVFAHDFLVWFHQAPLPKDPLNNPLAEAEPKLRIAGALRVYARGVGQILFPKTLSGDYSFPQEPVPTKLGLPRERPRRLLPTLEHVRALADRPGRAPVVLPGPGHDDGRRAGPDGRVRLGPEDSAARLRVDDPRGLPRLPGRARLLARHRLPRRSDVLEGHEGRGAEQRQGPPQLLGHGGRPRHDGGAPDAQPHLAQPRAEVGDGPRLHRRHPVPHGSPGRGVAALCARLRDRPEREGPGLAGPA